MCIEEDIEACKNVINLDFNSVQFKFNQIITGTQMVELPVKDISLS